MEIISTDSIYPDTESKFDRVRTIYSRTGDIRQIDFHKNNHKVVNTLGANDPNKLPSFWVCLQIVIPDKITKRTQIDGPCHALMKM